MIYKMLFLTLLMAAPAHANFDKPGQREVVQAALVVDHDAVTPYPAIYFTDAQREKVADQVLPSVDPQEALKQNGEHKNPISVVAMIFVIWFILFCLALLFWVLSHERRRSQFDANGEYLAGTLNRRRDE
jgi:cbb3-type cytochrome oxidase subunit 3